MKLSRLDLTILDVKRHGDFMNVGQLRFLKQDIFSSKVENKIHEKETIFLIVKMSDKDFFIIRLSMASLNRCQKT